MGGAGGQDLSSQGGSSEYAQKYADMIGGRLTELRSVADALGDKDLSSFVNEFCNTVVANASFIVAHDVFKHSMGGSDEDYIKPLMGMAKAIPQAGNWNIHIRDKHGFLKKAVQEGFSVFFWSRLRNSKAFEDDMFMKDYIN